MGKAFTINNIVLFSVSPLALAGRRLKKWVAPILD
jgi:hypothetical protein